MTIWTPDTCCENEGPAANPCKIKFNKAGKAKIISTCEFHSGATIRDIHKENIRKNLKFNELNTTLRAEFPGLPEIEFSFSRDNQGRRKHTFPIPKAVRSTLTAAQKLRYQTLAQTVIDTNHIVDDASLLDDPAGDFVED